MLVITFILWTLSYYIQFNYDQGIIHQLNLLLHAWFANNFASTAPFAADQLCYKSMNQTNFCKEIRLQVCVFN